MAKVIFFNIPAQGHINPSLPVITELVRRGEQVICVNTAETESQYAATGARFVSTPNTDKLSQLVSQSSGGDIPGNALALVQIAEVIMPFVLDLLQREKPDYVIYDSLCSWAKQAVEKLGIRAATSLSTFAMTPASLPPFTPVMILDTLRQAVPRFPRYWQTAARMRRNFGVKGVGLFGAVMSTGDFNIVYTSSLFQPGAEKLGDRFRFVGPSIAERPVAVDFPYEQLTRHPAVYISLGTINNQNTAFYRQCFEAFHDFNGQVILSVGRRTDIAALGDVPENFIVRGFVPQLDVLQRSDIFITHGGMNSVHEGLYYGVPLVVIPQQVEQAVVARQVVRHGAGIALGDQPPYGQVSARQLRDAVNHIQSERETYQAAAARLGDSFRASGGYIRAAEELIAFGQGQLSAF